MKKKLHFPRNQRLLTKAEFKSVFDQSRKVSQKHLLVLFKASPQAKNRLGVIVGKRVAKKAVTRNTIKRIMRESFRLNQAMFSGLDLIIIARAQCDKLEKVELRRGIDKLWEKLRDDLKKYSPTPSL